MEKKTFLMAVCCLSILNVSRADMEKMTREEREAREVAYSDMMSEYETLNMDENV